MRNIALTLSYDGSAYHGWQVQKTERTVGQTLEEAAALCKQRSRNYAKRQLTWFRRNPDIRWLRLTGAEDFSEVLSAARQNVPFSAL